MKRVGEDVLSGAGLAEQDDGEVTLGDEIDDAVELAHGFVGDDDGWALRCLAASTCGRGRLGAATGRRRWLQRPRVHDEQ